MKDGSVLSGVIVRENATNVFLRTAESPERPVPVPKAQIANRGESVGVADARGAARRIQPGRDFQPPGVRAGATAGEVMRAGAFALLTSLSRRAGAGSTDVEHPRSRKARRRVDSDRLASAQPARRRVARYARARAQGGRASGLRAELGGEEPAHAQVAQAARHRSRHLESFLLADSAGNRRRGAEKRLRGARRRHAARRDARRALRADAEAEGSRRPDFSRPSSAAGGGERRAGSGAALRADCQRVRVQRRARRAERPHRQREGGGRSDAPSLRARPSRASGSSPARSSARSAATVWPARAPPPGPTASSRTSSSCRATSRSDPAPKPPMPCCSVRIRRRRSSASTTRWRWA